MKLSSLLFVLLAVATASASADTYVAVPGKKTSNPDDEFKRVSRTSQDQTCAFDGKTFELGDVVVVAVPDMVLVCTSGSDKAVLRRLSVSDAQSFSTVVKPSSK